MLATAIVTSLSRTRWTQPFRAPVVRICLACLVCAALLASGYVVGRTMDRRTIPMAPATVVAPVVD